MKQRSPFKCIGFGGWLCGHKFNYDTAEFKYHQFPDHCQRCGMPLGGWPAK